MPLDEESIESLKQELQKVRAEKENLQQRVDLMMGAHNLEFLSPEDLNIESLEKRLMGFISSLASQEEGKDLNQIIVDEIRRSFLADRVVLMVAGSELEQGYVVTHQACAPGHRGVQLPYYNSMKEGPREYNEFLASVKSTEGVKSISWPRPHNLFDQFEISRACAQQIINPNTGILLVAMQWVKPGPLPSPLEQQLFNEMMRFAGLVFGQTQLIQNLSDLEEQYSSLIESMPSALIGVDFLGNVTLWNSRAESFFKMSAEEMLGKNLGEKIPLLNPVCMRIMEAFASNEEIVFNPMRTIDRSGQERHLRPHLFSMVGAERGEVGIRIDDVTEETRLQRQLLANLKTEVFGQISWGMARNFSKLVGSLAGTVALMKKRWKTEEHPPMDHDDLRDIEGMAHRATNLATKLLELSQPRTEALDVIDLVAVTRSVVDLAENSFDSRIEFIVNLPYSSILIRAVANRLETALLNVLMNARDALPQGGVLSVQLSEISEEEPKVILSVTDNGEGMSEETLNRAGFPMFTTKERGQGLGLAFVEQTCKNLGGRMQIESQLGLGTRVNLELPVIEISRSAKDAQENQRNQSLLIVEDDDAIRHLVERILRNLKLEFSSAEDGLEATKLIHQNKNCGLVILDLDMPGLSGPDTFRLIRQLNPNQKFLLTTVEPNRAEYQKWKSLGQVHLIGKPFSVESFESEVDYLMED